MFDKYGHYLKTKGVQGIFVNGWTGEGMTLTFDERIKTAEVWFKVAQKYGMKMFLFLGGLPLPEMYQLVSVHSAGQSNWLHRPMVVFLQAELAPRLFD